MFDRKKLKLTLLSALLVLPLMHSQILLAGEERRKPPEAQSAGTLSEPVMRAISAIQELMSPEDATDEPDYERAKQELDDLYERRYNRMNDFEKATTLAFYTNYYLTTDNIPEAIRIFEQQLTIEKLREDTRLRALKTLGQLHAAEENWDQSITFFQQWRELSLEEDPIVYKGLAYAHQQQELFREALPFWLDYMQLVKDSPGEGLTKNDYNFLNGLYFQMEDYENALVVTKNLVVMFDEAVDWRNLSAIYGSLDDDEKRINSMAVAYVKGYFENDTQYLNLGQSLAGEEAPLTGAKIIRTGNEGGIVPEEANTYEILTQLYMVANAFNEAVAPGTKLAELSETGDGYDTLGYIYYQLHDYEAAVSAFESALDKGDLNDRADTLFFYANALMELDRYDDALAATRQSGEAGDSDDVEKAQNFAKFIESTKTRADILASRKEAAIDFYKSYPPLN